MSTIDPIEHISAYCDRWCERCAFTSRCSLYAVEIATGMCDGDYRAGLELALGVPCRPGQNKREPIRDLPNEQPTEAEMAETTRESDALDDRLDELPISTLAWKVMLLGRRWLDSYGERWCASAPLLGEAMQIASGTAASSRQSFGEHSPGATSSCTVTSLTTTPYRTTGTAPPRSR